MSIRGLLSKLGGGINNLGSKMGDLQGDPMFNLGVGLLAQGQPGPGAARSFGQGLLGAMDYSANKTAQFQNLQNSREMMKMRRDAATRQQEQFDLAKEQRQKQELAQAGLLNMMQNPASSVPASIRRPGAIQDEQSKMMGLLMQANPQAATSGLLSSMFTPPKDLPSDVRTMQYLQQNPGMIELYQNMKNPMSETDRLAAGINADLANERLAEAQDARDLRNRTDRINNRVSQNTFREIKNLTGLMEDTAGTRVQTGGLPSRFGNVDAVKRYLEETFEMDSTESSTLANQYDLLNKGFGRLLSAVIPEGTTNMGITRLQEANPGMGMQPGANAKILMDALDDALAQDFDYDGEINMLDVDEVNEIKARLQRIMEAELRGAVVPTPPAGYGPL